MASDPQENEQPSYDTNQQREPSPRQEPYSGRPYEPSTPSEPPGRDGQELGFRDILHEPQQHRTHEGLPPGTRLIDILGAAFARVWRTSHTVLRLDLRRALELDGPIVGGSYSRTAYGRGGRGALAPSYPDDWVDGSVHSSGWIQGIHGGGLRLNLMQIWDFPDKETGLPSLPWNLNFGLGTTLETDRGGHLQLETRVKTKHLALYILPLPFLEVRGKWPITGTRIAVDVRYRIPLNEPEKMWESPSAQLFVCLYNPVGTGFHLSPGGLEFDEHILDIGKQTKLRVAASIEFPRRFPLEEGEQPIRVHVNRLGIKSRIT